MQILIAEYAGFCEGVEKAYQIALETSKKNKPIYMLGHLVHNTQVVEKLEKLDIRSVKNISEIPDNSKGILLISAHGVAPKVYDEAKARGLEIVDTTCNWVKRAQKFSRELEKLGYQVIILGDKGHPEVKGIKGWSKDKALVVENPQDLDKINFAKLGKVGLVAQTTQSEENFNTIVDKIRQKKIKDVVIHNTICGATSKRQNAAMNIAHKVDLMLVIGDKKSANTKRLTQLCSEAGAKTYQIQTAGELKKEWFLGKDRLGVTAGASTPEWVIKEVLEKLKGKNDA